MKKTIESNFCPWEETTWISKTLVYTNYTWAIPTVLFLYANKKWFTKDSYKEYPSTVLISKSALVYMSLKWTCTGSFTSTRVEHW